MYKKLFLLITISPAVLLAGCAVNPVTGDEELMIFPKKYDIALGKKYAPLIEKHMGGAVDSNSIQQYVESIGQKIARISHLSEFDYHFTALEHDSINAFALPGGYVFITKGLLEKIQTEAQLAAILAHEVTHIVARDTSNALSKQIGMFALLVGIASQQPSRGVFEAAIMVEQILALKYSRDDERSADLEGMKYMVRAGYDPNGMVEVMQSLQDEQKIKPVEFFSTHPSFPNRLAYIKRRMSIKKYISIRLKTGAEDYEKNVLEKLKTQKLDKLQKLLEEKKKQTRSMQSP